MHSAMFIGRLLGSGTVLGEEAEKQITIYTNVMMMNAVFKYSRVRRQSKGCYVRNICQGQSL